MSRRPAVRLRLRVGGLTLAVRADGGGRLRPPARHRPFLASRGGDIRLRLCDDGAPRPDARQLAFDSGGPWRAYRLEGGWLYRFLCGRSGRWREAEALALDDGLREGRLFPDPVHARRHALCWPVDELLFQHRLALDGHLVLHACGLALPPGAVLLCGASGAGKTTSARLWARHRPGTLVLSDDRVVVRRDGSRLRAFGTPWHGEARFASPTSRPLAAVFFLEKARATRLRRLAPAEAATALYARSFPPPWRAEAVGATLDACAAVAEAVPAYALRFRPDGTAVEAVLAALDRHRVPGVRPWPVPAGATAPIPRSVSTKPR